MKTKYRINRYYYDGIPFYFCERKRWWWPFWCIIFCTVADCPEDSERSLREYLAGQLVTPKPKYPKILDI